MLVSWSTRLGLWRGLTSTQKLTLREEMESRALSCWCSPPLAGLQAPGVFQKETKAGNSFHCKGWILFDQHFPQRFASELFIQCIHRRKKKKKREKSICAKSWFFFFFHLISAAMHFAMNHLLSLMLKMLLLREEEERRGKKRKGGTV